MTIAGFSLASNGVQEVGLASHFFHDRGLGRAVKVLPGEFFVSDEEIAIQTVLGSCIAACIWDGARKVGGMNHFMLPEGGADDGESGRYGVFAMELLINALLKRGASRANLKSKIFGGGAVMRGFTSLNVGEKNARFVEKFLSTERIPVVSRDLCDVYPRKVVFYPASGRALMKKLPVTDHTVEIMEQKYGKSLATTPKAGDVELF
ncbi:MAG: chemoreceptor glutamine deamidase CheD [Betaproteobacteria bacterium]|nr:chemoreceptor glutamine deamidase CheD [Betaproteobacteria bacterium]